MAMREFYIGLKQWLTFYPPYLAGFFYLNHFINRNVAVAYWALFFLTDIKYRLECRKRNMMAGRKKLEKELMTVSEYFKKWGIAR
jgi:hypothetical protein